MGGVSSKPSNSTSNSSNEQFTIIENNIQGEVTTTTTIISNQL